MCSLLLSLPSRHLVHQNSNQKQWQMHILRLLRKEKKILGQLPSESIKMWNVCAVEHYLYASTSNALVYYEETHYLSVSISRYNKFIRPQEWQRYGSFSDSRLSRIKVYQTQCILSYDHINRLSCNKYKYKFI